MKIIKADRWALPQFVLLSVNCFVFFFIGIFASRVYIYSAFPANQPSILRPQKVPRNALMWAEPSNIAVSEKASSQFSILIDAKNQVINGVDVVLLYDEKMLEVEEINTESSSLLFPRKKAENGKIHLTGIKIEADEVPFSTLPLATITFKALKKGETTIAFDFRPNTTTGSTIIKAHGSENILGKIKNNVTINIQ